MQARTRWWLLAIIALVVASLLGVLEPIKFKQRTNPDTGKPVKEIQKIGPFYIYKPHLGLTLGLDLRGGMHLVLQALDEGLFTYSSSQIKAPLSEEDAFKVHEQVANLLVPASKEKVGTEKLDVSVNQDTGQIEVRTRVASRADVTAQNEKILALLKTIYPDVQNPKDKPPYYNEVKPDTLNQIKTVLSTRVDALGLTEPVIQALPQEHRILVDLPGVKDPAKAKELVQQTAKLEFRKVPRNYGYGQEYGPKFNQDTKTYSFTDVNGKEVSVDVVLRDSPVLLTGNQLVPNSSHVRAAVGQETAVSFEFAGPARKILEDYSRGHVNYYLAIVLDNKLYMVPVIKSVLQGGSGEISGSFDGEEGMKKATELSILLNAGALPFDLQYVENRTVSPELGAGHLRTALYGGLIGLIAVLVFMVLYYRLPGLLADLALVVYICLLLGTIKLTQQVLTLPGILAVIISIGMAVDANIIIFERLKEEIRTGKTLRSALEAAFKRAWTAILDSNVCSIGTGLVLFAFGTGPIKGFAVALVIGVAVSLFTAVTVTRLFMSIVVESKLGQNISLYGVSPKEITG